MLHREKETQLSRGFSQVSRAIHLGLLMPFDRILSCLQKHDLFSLSYKSLLILSSQVLSSKDTKIRIDFAISIYANNCWE